MKSIQAVCTVSVESLDESGEMVEYQQRHSWLKKGEREKNTVEYTIIPEQFRSRKTISDPNGRTRVRVVATDTQITAYNGEATKWFTPERKEGGIYKDSYSMHVTPARWLLPEVTNMSLTDYLSKQDTMVNSLGVADDEQEKLHCLTFSDRRSTGKVYVGDFDGSPVPVRYQCQLENVIIKYAADHFEKFGSVTLPTSVVVEVYRVLPDSEKLLERETVKMEKLIVNGEIADRDLQIEFPAGTRISDMRSNKLYIVAGDGTWKEPVSRRRQRLVEPTK